MLKLVFPGEPRAIQSVRFAKRGNFVTKYQPKANTDWKVYIKLLAMEQLPENWHVLTGAIGVRLRFRFSPLKSMSKRERSALAAGELRYKVTKPDLTDNLCKGVIDALTGIVWRDDALICRVESLKCYADKPEIEIQVINLNLEDM